MELRAITRSGKIVVGEEAIRLLASGEAVPIRNDLAIRDIEVATVNRRRPN